MRSMRRSRSSTSCRVCWERMASWCCESVGESGREGTADDLGMLLSRACKGVGEGIGCSGRRVTRGRLEGIVEGPAAGKDESSSRNAGGTDVEEDGPAAVGGGGMEKKTLPSSSSLTTLVGDKVCPDDEGARARVAEEEECGGDAEEGLSLADLRRAALTATSRGVRVVPS
jgi:hypothetical protein